MIEYIEKSKAYEVLSDYYHHRTQGQHEALREAFSRVPTADVVEKERYDRLLENALIISEALREYQDAEMLERKKGKWIQRSDTPWYYYCSNCYRVISVASVNKCGESVPHLSNFCPNCGAKMYGKEKEDE